MAQDKTRLNTHRKARSNQNVDRILHRLVPPVQQGSPGAEHLGKKLGTTYCTQSKRTN